MFQLIAVFVKAAGLGGGGFASGGNIVRQGVLFFLHHDAVDEEGLDLGSNFRGKNLPGGHVGFPFQGLAVRGRAQNQPGLHQDAAVGCRRHHPGDLKG